MGDMFVFLVRDCLRENLSYVGRKWSGEGWREGRGGPGGMYGGMGNLGEGLLEGRDGGRGSLRHEKGKTRPVLVAGDVGCKGRLGLVLFQKQMITI